MNSQEINRDIELLKVIINNLTLDNFDDYTKEILNKAVNYLNELKAKDNDVKSYERKIAELTDNMYPVGTVYTTTSPTSPNMRFGGTWNLLSQTQNGNNIEYKWNRTE